MSISQRIFGIDQIGRPMTLYTMTNQRGASASILDYGAHIQSILVPDRAGRLTEVCLGFDELAPYEASHGSIGATIGRYANRIGGAKFTLNGEEYTLFPNDHGNCLHGGRENFQFKWFKGETVSDDHEDTVLLTYVSHDGEEGFPGKMRLQVTFSWNDDCQLTIRYLAQSDKDTIVNLTNHSYFNLSGEGDILPVRMTIAADQITETDDLLIPTGTLLPVAGTPFDFRAGQVLGEGIAHRDTCHALDNADGYDVNFCVPGTGMREMASALDPRSGIGMRVLSDQPGVQLYTGQGLHHTGHGGTEYKKYGGFALETQHWADSPHHDNFPSTVLRAGDVFKTATIYEFSVK